MARISTNTITLVAPFLTHQVLHTRAQYSPYYSTCSFLATSQRVYLHTKRWNLRKCEVQIVRPRSRSESRVPSGSRPRRRSTSPEDLRRQLYRHLGCLPCLMMTRRSLPPLEALTRCRPPCLLLFNESLQA